MDILKVGHHSYGASKKTSKENLQLAFSAGLNDLYGHPHQQNQILFTA